MKNILIVDDESPFLLSLTDGLGSYADKMKVYNALNGKEAVKVIESVKLDLIITDLNMPVMNGFELLAYITSRHLAVPVIVMTAFGTPEIEEKLNSMGSFQYMEKPLDIDALSEKIESVINDSAKGYIHGITLPTFLQLLEMEKKSCTLNIKSSGRSGRMFFRAGDLLNAETGALSGLEAAYEVVCWENVEIEMLGKCEKNVRKINMSLGSILMESCRIQDEAKRDEERREEQQSENDSAEDEDFALEPFELEGAEEDADVTSNHKEEIPMGVQDQLKELTTLEGFAGVGLFTPTGESLAILTADDKINFAEIGVLANNVLMNAQKASLEMGTGRGQQVHVQAEHAQILVRCLNEGTDPLKSQPGKAHIHLVLVLTSESSIGMAKMKINKVVEAVAGDFRM